MFVLGSAQEGLQPLPSDSESDDSDDGDNEFPEDDKEEAPVLDQSRIPEYVLIIHLIINTISVYCI